MTTTINHEGEHVMPDNDNAAKVEEILTRRDDKGAPLSDHVRRGEDGQLLARRAADHTREDRVA